MPEYCWGKNTSHTTVQTAAATMNGHHPPSSPEFCTLPKSSCSHSSLTEASSILAHNLQSPSHWLISCPHFTEKIETTKQEFPQLPATKPTSIQISHAPLSQCECPSTFLGEFLHQCLFLFRGCYSLSYLLFSVILSFFPFCCVHANSTSIIWIKTSVSFQLLPSPYFSERAKRFERVSYSLHFLTFPPASQLTVIWPLFPWLHWNCIRKGHQQLPCF